MTWTLQATGQVITALSVFQWNPNRQYRCTDTEGHTIYVWAQTIDAAVEKLATQVKRMCIVTVEL